QTNTTFPYSIPARSSQKLVTSGLPAMTQAESVRAIPNSGTASPSGLTIFSYRKNGVTVTEAGVPVIADGIAFRLYAEIEGQVGAPGSIQTDVAIANTSASTAMVTLELFDVDGNTTGLVGALTIPANGQVNTFLNGIPGLTALPASFKGV